MKMVVVVSFALFFIPAPASLPLPSVHDHHAVDVETVLRALIAQQPGVVCEQVVVMTDVVDVVVMVVAPVCMSASSCLAAAAGVRVVVVREDAVHP
jgi:hypothetical protein